MVPFALGFNSSKAVCKIKPSFGNISIARFRIQYASAGISYHNNSSSEPFFPVIESAQPRHDLNSLILPHPCLRLAQSELLLGLLDGNDEDPTETLEGSLLPEIGGLLGARDITADGCSEGSSIGAADVTLTGNADGTTSANEEGVELGIMHDNKLGSLDASWIGSIEGIRDGIASSTGDGPSEGNDEGLLLKTTVGLALGLAFPIGYLLGNCDNAFAGICEGVNQDCRKIAQDRNFKYLTLATFLTT